MLQFNHGDTPDRSSSLACPSLVFTVVTPLVVLARFLSRRVTGKIGVDDWVILVSCVCLSAFLSPLCVCGVCVSVRRC